MRTRTFLWAAAVVLTFVAGCHLAQPSSDYLRVTTGLNAEVTKAFADKDYATAAQKCEEMIKLLPTVPAPWYNLACAQAHLGKKDEAVKSLMKSVELGFNESAHMAKDPDLDTLRDDPLYKDIEKKVQANSVMGGAYSAPVDVPGVKTVEGSPPKGLRWRLRMGPDATKEKPERLIIWLHPSGGSMNEIVEKLAPRFNKDGCALLVLTQKNWSYWNADEGDQLMDHTLPDVAKLDGIDASRPILLGFSAGGQMALEMYEKAPAKFGGLVLDAAYPMQVDGLSIRRPPKDDAIRKVPIFVIVGERDGGARIWKQAEPIWRGAGVPLVVHFIPEKVHQWLFGPEQLDELDKWLKEVGEGKLPGAAQPPQPPAIKAEAPRDVAVLH